MNQLGVDTLQRRVEVRPGNPTQGYVPKEVQECKGHQTPCPFHLYLFIYPHSQKLHTSKDVLIFLTVKVCSHVYLLWLTQNPQLVS